MKPATSLGDTGQEPSPELLLRLYREMVRLRTLDERMMTLQRQGRVGFYGACTGQEAATLASAIALEPLDWIFPALREAAAMLLRGFPLVPYLCQVFGNSGDETMSIAASRVVGTPPISNSRSARSARSIASGRFSSQTTSFASSES